MTWKIEKRTLNGLETYCIVSGNGAMRHASTEEVDMWTDILKLKAERDALVDSINKLGLMVQETLKTHTGSGIKEKVPSTSAPSTSSSSTAASSTSGSASSSSPSAKKDPVTGGTVVGTSSGFGKRAWTEDMAKTYAKKTKKWPENFTPSEELRARYAKNYGVK